MANPIRQALEQSLETATAPRKVEILFDFMRERGQSHYDESVTQIEHALQCAESAAHDGCSDQVVTAALFHDIGHLLLDEHAAHAENRFLEDDLIHEEAGADLLMAYFPPQVTEPIRLHVPAKRYLCTVDPDYYDTLSAASKRSFEIQGGCLTEDELAELESNPGLETALQLRHYDDKGKQLDHAAPPIDSYAERVKRCLRVGQA